MRRALPLAAFALMLAGPASAEVSIAGTADYVSIEAKGATLQEIVGAVTDKTGVAIEIKGSTDRQFEGAFHGPVEDVLAQILRNTSFALTEDDPANGLKLHLLLLNSGAATPGPTL